MIFDRNQVAERVKELSSHNIYIGTSSWKYEGWLGQLYTPERYSYRGKVAFIKPQRPSFIFVINRLEGSALGTIEGALGK